MAQDNENESKDIQIINDHRFALYKPLIENSLKYESNEENILLTNIEAIYNSEDNFEEIYVTYNTNNDRQKIRVDCEIMFACEYDDFSPSQLVEYQFNKNGKWYLSKICKNCCDAFRSMKFKDWKKQIEQPDCKASLRRLLRLGVITKIYDTKMFPSPQNEIEQYQVAMKTKSGKDKIVDIPRPVNALRVWNGKFYENVETHLDGAPKTKEEIDALWNPLKEAIEQMLEDDNFAQ